MPAGDLTKKMGMRPGHRVLVLNAPDGFTETLAPLPERVALETTPTGGAFDLIHVFVHDKAEVDRMAPDALAVLSPGGLLWFSHPKKSSKIKTDITRDVGWDILAVSGLRPVSLVSIDETWSAFRFRPVEDVNPRNGK